MNSSEVDLLFAQTLLGDYETDAAWTAVGALQRDGSLEIFERAAAWTTSEDPLRRARAADVLGQLRRAPERNRPGDELEPREPEWMFRDESYLLVTQILLNEQVPMVLIAAIGALGHLYMTGALPLILRFQAHPDKDVRFAVTFALGCFPHNVQSVDALLRLTADADSDVRDWAVFGLGVLGDVDTPEVRDALLRCLDDVDEDVRQEAAVGLGKRRDQRLIPKLMAMLDKTELPSRVGEAAAALLELNPDPPEWVGADYKAALISRFNIPG